MKKNVFVGDFARVCSATVMTFVQLRIENLGHRLAIARGKRRVLACTNFASQPGNNVPVILPVVVVFFPVPLFRQLRTMSALFCLGVASLQSCALRIQKAPRQQALQ